PGMDADADPDWPRLEPDQRLAHRRQRLVRGGECVEEPVPLVVDLVPSVSAERLPHDSPVLRERLAVGVRAELLEQLGRPLDVRALQRHCPRRLYIAHRGRLSLRGRDNGNAACPTVCQSGAMNIWDDEWGEQAEDWSGGGARSKRLVDRGPLLGASLYELERG